MTVTQSISTAEAYTTLHHWLRKVSDHTMRKYEIYRRLIGRGRVTLNMDGDEMVIPIQIDLPDTEPYFGGPVTIAESDKYRQIKLSPKPLTCGDSLDLLTQYRNRGTSALVKRIDRMADDIRKSVQRTLNESIYYDDTTKVGYPSGVESFLGAASGYDANDRIVLPDDTYGGVATDLQTFDGTWSNTLGTQPNTDLGYDWPLGSGDTRFDATSPFLFNVTSTNWTAGSADVEDNLEEIISIGPMWMSLTRGEEAAPDICVLSPDYWQIYEAIQRSKQQITVPHNPGQDVGFKGFRQNGVLVTTEYGVPGTRGYLLNTKTAELNCWTPQLLVPFFNQFEFRSLSTLWMALFYGQFGWQPNNTGKIYPYA